MLERSRSQLRDAEKLASVGKLAASVAHEIRNPLTAFKMWLFSIQKDVGGDAAMDRKFEIVSEEIARLETVVRGFLGTLASPGAEYISRVDLDDLGQDAGADLAPHRRPPCHAGARETARNLPPVSPIRNS